jgi:alkenylglycerophosphocholine/alkenylglycerophosphoethanolamine hydrolase
MGRQIGGRNLLAIIVAASQLANRRKTFHTPRLIGEDMEILSLWWPLVVMSVDWVAVAKGWRRAEYVAKPAAMVALLVWLWFNSAATGRWTPPLAWFVLGLVCSLGGDVLLMLSERYFIGGLVAFLLGHLAYIVGLNAGGLLLPLEALLLIPMALIGGWLFWRIGAAIKASGRSKLRVPVALYTAVISLMVVSALTTLFRPDAPIGPALLVGLGAVLFFISDAVLAWNRFVAPVPYGKLLVIVTYHLGQMAIIAGVVLDAQRAVFV